MISNEAAIGVGRSSRRRREGGRKKLQDPK